jgi:hypothetical protein
VNYDTTYNITEHKLQIVVDDTGDIFINTLDYSNNSVGIITELCCLTRDDAYQLVCILDKALARAQEIEDAK